MEQSFLDQVKNFGLEWSGVFTIIFMFLICYFLWRTVKLMPRTKPVQIKPETKSSISWDEIAGVDESKDELKEVVDFLKDPKRFKALGARVPKGVLLHGPPGTGKTLLAKAVAHESGAQFFSQSAASFVEMFAGLGAARIRRLFREARKHAPAIIFIDELDAVGGRRGSDISGEREQTLNQLLVEMDGFDTSGDLVVMAASNLLEKLDPALLRPGRFDRQVFVTPPDVNGREKILEVHTRNKPVHDVDLASVAAQTSGLTGADLANLANEAAIRCARREGSRAQPPGLRRGARADHRRRPVAPRADRPREERDRLSRGRPRALRGAAAGRRSRPQDLDRAARQGAGLHAQPARRGSLPQDPRGADRPHDRPAGGRMAEQLVFGQVTTGASDDLKRVAAVAHAMVHDYAMGTPGTSQRAVPEDGSNSEQFRRVRDEEQHELAYQAQRTAQALLSDNRDKLDEIAEQLLRDEVIERGDLDTIMAGVPRRARHSGPGLKVVAARAHERAHGKGGGGDATHGAVSVPPPISDA